MVEADTNGSRTVADMGGNGSPHSGETGILVLSIRAATRNIFAQRSEPGAGSG